MWHRSAPTPTTGHTRCKRHQAGYSLDEIAPLVPQVPKAEIAAIIHQHDKETRL